MADSSTNIGSAKIYEVSDVAGRKGASKRCLIASPKSFSKNAIRNVASISRSRIAGGAVGHVALFLFKVAALETVRRISNAKFPFAWRGLQALQVLCYPPFKWVKKWTPFKGLVRGMESLSRPLLVLSIATSLSEVIDFSTMNSDGSSNSPSYSELHTEQSSVDSSRDTRTLDEAPQILESENWLIQLYKELENQGINLPERFNEDELQRFYTAANGDFACFLSSIKKTIRWRETYKILSPSELELWTHMVFWHGFDVRHRPCLIVRLGLACISLPSHNKPQFAQAVISQVEYGVTHLVDAENPQITVLFDCEGLTTLRIPMQMMRSCSSLLQDNFPNRLGCLFVIRVPPVARVLAQTFIQVLKPVTRKKLKIVGEMYEKVLTDYLQALPSYLGSKCTCTTCSKINVHDIPQPRATETEMIEQVGDDNRIRNLMLPHDLIYEPDVHLNAYCDQVFVHRVAQEPSLQVRERVLWDNMPDVEALKWPGARVHSHVLHRMHPRI